MYDCPGFVFGFLVFILCIFLIPLKGRQIYQECVNNKCKEKSYDRRYNIIYILIISIILGAVIGGIGYKIGFAYNNPLLATGIATNEYVKDAIMN